jgi:formylglycine-generating enzyme required for sulfatase activity
VNRGGSWNNTPQNCRTANRNNWQPDNRNRNNGFRLALSLQLTDRPDGYL